MKANSSNPTVRPGNGWYRVPALETTASFVVGPWASLEAILRPDMSDVSNAPAPAAAAKQWGRGRRALQDRQRVLWALLARIDLEIIVETGGWAWVVLKPSIVLTALDLGVKDGLIFGLSGSSSLT